ncbi:MAG: DUF1015 domain-containing protein [Psychroflexus sp.]|nr:DUF1015 domain-containing protein [Psychroflexus sp.]MDN6310520.1 DUF1015 domain-containing protein [Psychroflexus sp.]
MPIVKPFKAIRPSRDKAGLIASRPYETYSKAQREARLDNNPFSFLHIVNPGYKYHKEISGPQRFKLVKNRYEEFKEDGSFIKDETANFYLHKIVYRKRIEFVGIVGAASVDDYENRIIRKHEDTISEKVEIYNDYLKTVRFNADPVLLTHPENNKIEMIKQKMMQERAEYEFTTTSRETHYLWLIKDQDDIDTIQKEFGKMSHFYIADGHHRTNSSISLRAAIAKDNKKHTGEEAYNFFMSYLIPECQLQIFEFNRLIKTLNGLSKENFLIQLDEYFKIENRGQNYYKPSGKHKFSMYLENEFYSLALRKNSYQFTDALSQLDAQILFKTILEPTLGITDLRHDKRIKYVQGQKDMTYVKGAIDNGDYRVGFGLFPVTVNEMKLIADESLVMPPKTTYIDPKLRSGITIYEF